MIAQIDPRTSRPQYDQAVAKQKQDKALLGDREEQPRPHAEPGQQGRPEYVSKQDLDNLKNTSTSCVATVMPTRPRSAPRQVQLGFTKVISPIDGVAGIRSVDPATS